MSYNKTVSKKLLLFLSGFFGFGFLAFTKLVKRNTFDKLDFDLIVKLQDKFGQSTGKSTETFQPIFTTSSTLSSFELVTIFAGLLTLVLLFKRKWGAIFILPSLAVAHLVEIYGKTTIDHQAPPMYFVKEFDTVLFPTWYAHPESSYPSGHAMRAVFFITILVFLVLRSKYKKNTRLIVALILIVYCTVAVVGRVALGTHWPTDVAGGVLLGLTFSLFALLFI